MPVIRLSSASVNGGASRYSGICGSTDPLGCVGNRVSTILSITSATIGAFLVNAPSCRITILYPKPHGSLFRSSLSLSQHRHLLVLMARPRAFFAVRYSKLLRAKSRSLFLPRWATRLSFMHFFLSSAISFVYEYAGRLPPRALHLVYNKNNDNNNRK